MFARILCKHWKLCLWLINKKKVPSQTAVGSTCPIPPLQMNKIEREREGKKREKWRWKEYEKDRVKGPHILHLINGLVSSFLPSNNMWNNESTKVKRTFILKNWSEMVLEVVQILSVFNCYSSTTRIDPTIVQCLHSLRNPSNQSCFRNTEWKERQGLMSTLRVCYVISWLCARHRNGPQAGLLYKWFWLSTTHPNKNNIYINTFIY